MDYQIVWSYGAIVDLEEICGFIAQHDPEAAQGVGEGILDHVAILATFPYIGPSYPKGTRGSSREIVFRPYRIFYDVVEDLRQVEILHVWHGARDEPPLPL